MQKITAGLPDRVTCHARPVLLPARTLTTVRNRWSLS